jgi:hypothetical protein
MNLADNFSSLSSIARTEDGLDRETIYAQIRSSTIKQVEDKYAWLNELHRHYLANKGIPDEVLTANSRSPAPEPVGRTQSCPCFHNSRETKAKRSHQ